MSDILLLLGCSARARVYVCGWGRGGGDEFLRATQQCEDITARAHHKPPASSLHAMVRFRKWVLMQFLFSIISVFEYFGVQIPNKWSSTLYCKCQKIQ